MKEGQGHYLEEKNRGTLIDHGFKMEAEKAFREDGLNRSEWKPTPAKIAAALGTEFGSRFHLDPGGIKGGGGYLIISFLELKCAHE